MLILIGKVMLLEAKMLLHMGYFGVSKQIMGGIDDKQTYDWKALSTERKLQVKRIGKIMGVSDVVLTSHIRSVEYLLSEREKRKDLKRKHRILNA